MRKERERRQGRTKNQCLNKQKRVEEVLEGSINPLTGKKPLRTGVKISAH